MGWSKPVYLVYRAKFYQPASHPGIDATISPSANAVSTSRQIILGRLRTGSLYQKASTFFIKSHYYLIVEKSCEALQVYGKAVLLANKRT